MSKVSFFIPIIVGLLLVAYGIAQHHMYSTVCGAIILLGMVLAQFMRRSKKKLG